MIYHNVIKVYHYLPDMFVYCFFTKIFSTNTVYKCIYVCIHTVLKLDCDSNHVFTLPYTNWRRFPL